AMQLIVADTKYQPADLIESGWPSLWQPVPAADTQSAWQVEQTGQQWSAHLTSSAPPQWLRYYHKFLNAAAWERLMSGIPLEPTDEYDSTLITDYLAYNSSYQWGRDRIYRGNQLRPEIKGDITAM